MSWNSIQDKIMTIANAGVWFFIAFVGVQISVVIVSTLICRRKVLSAIRQVETTRQVIVGQIRDVWEEPGQQPSQPEQTGIARLRTAWRPAFDAPFADVRNLLQAASLLLLERQEESARRTIRSFRERLGNDVGQQKDLGVMATQGGLLGTVLGSIDAIGKMAQNGKGDKMEAILGALSFALWTTVVGLCLAIGLRMTLKYLSEPIFTKLEDAIDDAFQDICLRMAKRRCIPPPDEAGTSRIQTTPSTIQKRHQPVHVRPTTR